MTDITVVSTPVIVEVSPQVYTVTVSSVGAQGATGSAGQINSVSATTLAAGSSATVVNNGTTTNAQLAFGIPRGDKGDAGNAATVAAGTTTGLAAGSAPTVTNSGTTSAAVFNFGIPQGTKGDTGTAATATAGTTTTGNAGTNATVVNSGTTSAAVFDFTIPRGNTGAAATATAGTTTTGAAGTNASVTNSGTTSAAVFNFTIPRGDTGAIGQGFTYRNAWVSGTSYAAYDVVTYNGSTYVCILAVSGTTIPSSDSTHWTLTASKGDTGTAATIAVNSTTTGAAGTNATVTNSGSSSAASLDFTIPRGNTGQGYTQRGAYSASTTYAPYDVVYYNGTTYSCILASLNHDPSSTTYWQKMALGMGAPFTYNALDTYNVGDIVTRLGSSYYCVATTTGNAPPNTTYWSLLVSVGATGATGPTGPQGNGIPTFWYSPTSNYTTGTLVANTPVDPFGLTNGVTVGNSKTYWVEGVISGYFTHSTAITTALRVQMAGNAVSNVNFNALQAGFLGSTANGTWLATNQFSGYINGTAVWSFGGTTAASGTQAQVTFTFKGILRTASSGSYFQPKVGLNTVATTSTWTTNRESYVALYELGADTATSLGTWS